METIAVKNLRASNVYNHREFVLGLGDIARIEKVPANEVSGRQKYRITFFTTRECYDVCDLSETEASRLMQRLLDFARDEARGETLTITISPDEVVVKET